MTPVEARGIGFPGNFAELTVKDGKMSLDRFGRGGELQARPGAPPRTISGPPDFLARYGRFEVASGVLNVSFSPDLPTVAQVYRELYPQAGGNPIDGVIRVDPIGLAALLRYTGPIEVPSAPKPLTAENAADFLLREQYVTFAGANAERIDVLDDLGHATFDKLTKVDLPNPQQLARDLGPMVDGEHLSMSTYDAAEERLLDSTGVSAAVPSGGGDQLGVVVNNIGGNKIDLFLQRDVDYQVDWNPTTGALDATATVSLHNTAPASGLPLDVIGNIVDLKSPDHSAPPVGTNRTYVSIYTPWIPTDSTLDGTATPFQLEDELGRKVTSVQLDIAAGQTRTIVVKLHGQLPAGGPYHLDLWRQPLVIDGVGRVRLRTPDGRTTEREMSLAVNGSLTFAPR